MIIRSGKATVEVASEQRARQNGMCSSAKLSDDGGLTQFGAYIETLEPGSRSSDRHWHEQEDEFLHMLTGTAIVVENDGVLAGGCSQCAPHHQSVCQFVFISNRRHTRDS